MALFGVYAIIELRCFDFHHYISFGVEAKHLHDSIKQVNSTIMLLKIEAFVSKTRRAPFSACSVQRSDKQMETLAFS